MQSVLNEYISLERSGSAFIEKYATTFRTIANEGHIRDAHAWFSFFGRWCRREVNWQNLRPSHTNWHNSNRRRVQVPCPMRRSRLATILLRRIYFECFISRDAYTVLMHLCKFLCGGLCDITVVLLRQDGWM